MAVTRFFSCVGVTHRPCVLIALGFCLGIVLERFIPVPVWGWPAILSAVFIGALVPYWRRKSFGILLACACVCAGAAALRSYTALADNHISRFIGLPAGGELMLKCRVVSEVENKQTARQVRVKFTAEAMELTAGGVSRRVCGRVLVTVFRAAEVAEGSELLLSGNLRAPSSFGGRGRLSYTETLSSQKIRAAFNVKKRGLCKTLNNRGVFFLPAWGRFCRWWLNEVYARYLSPGEAGLMQGLITGERSGITEHVKEIFLRSGTSHILAVSGMNVAMVAYGIFFVLSLLPVPRTVRMLAAVVLTAWYAYVAGSSSPVVRSAVMSSVFLLSYVLEREQETLNTLAIAVLAIVVVNPTQLFDVGFQLSFIGVLSLILISPLIVGLFPEGKQARFWNEYLGVSIAAFLGTTGIVAYYFGTITPVSLLANIPAVPLVALITALGAILLIFSGIPFFASVVAVALKTALNLFVGILYLFTLIPGGFFYLDMIPSLWQALMYYFLLLSLIWFTHHKVRIHPVWAIGL